MEKSYIIVYMKQSLICLLLLSFMFSGCGSQSAVQTDQTGEVQAVETEKTETAQVDTEPPLETVFDPSSISREVFDNTIAEVRLYIEKLNGIIKSKNYEGWKANLSDEYLRYISSPDFLKSTSEMPILQRQGIILGSTGDYFTYVVVPARANARVDDIEFLSQNRVKIITIDTRNNERLRLYELEKTGNTWKIIN